MFEWVYLEDLLEAQTTYTKWFSIDWVLAEIRGLARLPATGMFAQPHNLNLPDHCTL